MVNSYNPNNVIFQLSPFAMYGAILLLLLYYVQEGYSNCDNLPLPENYTTAWSWLHATKSDPRLYHAAVAANDKIVVTGGLASKVQHTINVNSVQQYDPNLDTWTSVSSNGDDPAARYGHGMLAWDSEYYILGGYNGSTLGDMHRLCLSANTIWQAAVAQDTELIVSRRFHTFTKVYSTEAVLYAVQFGGILRNATLTTQTILATVQRSSECGNAASTVAYSPISSIGNPPKRSHHVAISIRNPPYAQDAASCIIIYGGQDIFANEILGDMWEMCFNDSMAPIEPGWTEIAQLGTTPGNRYGHAADLTSLGRIFIFGGSGRFPKDYQDDAWEFHRSLRRWIKLEQTSKITPRRYHTASILGNAVYVFGGVERYATINGTLDRLSYGGASCAIDGSYMKYCLDGTSIVCDSCGAGEYVAESEIACLPCLSGTYSAVGTHQCTSCPEGTYGTESGAISINSCSACPSGTQSIAVGASTPLTCQDCIAGTFGNQTKATTCYDCPRGTYSAAGATGCLDCSPGYYSGEGKENCSACPSGTFGPPLATRLWCFSCPRGHYSNEGATVCEPCPIGTYGTTINATESNCIPCPRGTYADEVGLAQCKSCPIGTFSNESSANSSNVCTTCPNGTFTDRQTSVNCTEVPLGSFLTSASAVYKCPVNTYGAINAANATCIDCPGGSYTVEEGSLSIEACINCPAGYYGFESIPGCVPCPIGSYLDEVSAGSVECLPCQPMTFSNSSGQSSCDSCPESTFSLQNWTTCIPCQSAASQRGSECSSSRNGLECSGNGKCIYGVCVCNDNWSGHTCEQDECIISATCELQDAIGVASLDSFTNISNMKILRSIGAKGIASINVSISDGPASWNDVKWMLVDFSDGVTQVELPAPTIDADAWLDTSILCQNVSFQLHSTTSMNATVIPRELLNQVQTKRINFAGFLQSILEKDNGKQVEVYSSSASNGSAIEVNIPLNILYAKPMDILFLFEPNSADGTWYSQMLEIFPSMVAAIQDLIEDVAFGMATFNDATLFPKAGTSITEMLAIFANNSADMAVLSNYLEKSVVLLDKVQWRSSSQRRLILVGHGNVEVSAFSNSASISSFVQFIEQHNILPIVLTKAGAHSPVEAFANSLVFADTHYYTNTNDLPQTINEIFNTPSTHMYPRISHDQHNFASINVASLAPNTNLSVSIRAEMPSDPKYADITIQILGWSTIWLNVSTSLPGCSKLVTEKTKYINLYKGWFSPIDYDLLLVQQLGNWNMSTVRQDLPTGESDIILQSIRVNESSSFHLQVDLNASVGLNTPIIVKGLLASTGDEGSSCHLNVQFLNALISSNALDSFDQEYQSNNGWVFLHDTFNISGTSRIIRVNILCDVAVNAVNVSGIGIFIDPERSCECDTGYYYSTTATASGCKRCPAGSYCNSGVRIECPPNTFSSGGSGNCTACYAGWVCANGLTTPCTLGMFANLSTGCSPCPEGFACLQGASIQCTAGSSSPGGRTATECKSCLPGTYNTIAGSSTCQSCNGGTSSSYHRNYCLACKPGEFSSSGDYPCKSCPAGTFSTEGQTNCTLCPEGHFAETIASSRCSSCYKGSYADSKGSVHCTSCQPGFTTEQEASKNESDCQ